MVERRVGGWRGGSVEKEEELLERNVRVSYSAGKRIKQLKQAYFSCFITPVPSLLIANNQKRACVCSCVCNKYTQLFRVRVRGEWTGLKNDIIAQW